LEFILTAQQKSGLQQPIYANTLHMALLSEILIRRIHDVLNEKGRLVIVDKFAPSRTSTPPSRLLSAFLKSLESPSDSVDYITTETVLRLLIQRGFRDIYTTPLPHKDNSPWNIDWTMIVAHKETNKG
jgi:hypothetical protein